MTGDFDQESRQGDDATGTLRPRRLDQILSIILIGRMSIILITLSSRFGYGLSLRSRWPSPPGRRPVGAIADQAIEVITKLGDRRVVRVDVLVRTCQHDRALHRREYKNRELFPVDRLREPSGGIVQTLFDRLAPAGEIDCDKLTHRGVVIGELEARLPIGHPCRKFVINSPRRYASRTPKTRSIGSLTRSNTGWITAGQRFSRYHSKTARSKSSLVGNE